MTDRPIAIYGDSRSGNCYKLKHLCAELEQKKPGGLKALGILDECLRSRPYMTGDKMTIADIALFAYTHVADEGGFSLEGFPSVRAWIERISARPGFVPMQG